MDRPASILSAGRLRWWRGWAMLALIAAVFPVSPPVRADEVTRLIQEELRKRNLYFGDVDGRSSPQLSAALHRYQTRKGLLSTGETDASTLESLNITPLSGMPATLAASAPRPSMPPSPDNRDSGAGGWPDITVLRSDEARPTPQAGEAEAMALAGEHVGTATPAPPPAAAIAARRPRIEDVQEFVTRYLQAGQNNDAAAELHFYAEPIAFFDEGTVDHTYVAKAVAHYDHRWPERHFTVPGPVTVSDSPDHSPDKFVLNFRLEFNVRNSRYNVTGKTDNTWTVSGRGPAEWKIVSMQEQRVRGK